MRMWLVDPKVMCTNHLLGEHNEIHMLAGYLRNGRSVQGWVTKGQIDPDLLYDRHEELVKEFKRRGWNHKSPLPDLEIPNMDACVNKEENLVELLARCPKCREKYRETYGEALHNLLYILGMVMK